MEIREWDTKLKRRAAVGLAVVVVLFVASLLVSAVVSRVVEKKINNYFAQQDSSHYQISFKSLNVNLLTGSIKVDSIRVIPNDSVFSDSIKGVYAGELGTVHVQNFSYSNYLFHHKISLGKISIDNAQLSYLPNPFYVKKAKKVKRSKGVFKGKVKAIEVGIINVENTNLTKYKSDGSMYAEWNIDGVWLHIKHFKMDNRSVQNEPPFLVSELKIGGKTFAFNDADRYNMYTNDFSFNSSTQHLLVNGFQLKPKYSRKKFSKTLKHEDDMFDVSLKSVKLSGLNLEEVLTSKRLHLKSIEVDSPDVLIYRDKRVADGPYKYKQLVTTAIKEIPVSTKISSIVITGGKLTYEEQQANNKPIGSLFFDLEKIDVTNVCNITSEINKNPIMQVDLRAKIMGKGSLKAHFDFLLSCASDSFYVEGTLGKIPALAFNPITENLLGVKIESGIIHSVVFAFAGTDDASTGILELDYANVKVDILKADNTKNKFFSGAANGLVQDANTKGSHKYRKGYVYFERDKNKGFPAYLWKSLSSAIVPIVAPLAESKEHKFVRRTAEARYP